MNAQTALANHTHDSDLDFGFLVDELQRKLIDNTKNGTKPVFKTESGDLFKVYLDSFVNPVERQYHNCDCCKQFLNKFGGLVCMNPQGEAVSALWHGADVPELYQPAVSALAKAVSRAKVSGVFLTSEIFLGVPAKGGWPHFAVRPVAKFSGTAYSTGQAMAEKREDFKNVSRALAEIKTADLETAVLLLKTNALYRSDKVISQANWLLGLQAMLKATDHRLRRNKLWEQIAMAPAGFCHPRSGMLGTLLGDLSKGLPSKEIFDNFAKKMAPDRYQRPQVAPTEGAIEAAEKLFKKMGAEKSLDRRFCRVDELQTVWTPREEVPTEGLFGHLTPKGTNPTPIETGVQTITWEKFRNTVMPMADRIECMAPPKGDYTAFVTAVHPEAPPIFQWDVEEDRNPASRYVWMNGSLASSFGLKANQFYPVAAISFNPASWSGRPTSQQESVVFVIEGAHETRSNTGSALFPEMLKTEYHSVRSVVEAYSRSKALAGLNEPHAAGLSMTKDVAPTSGWIRLQVWAGKTCLNYKIDRWD